jgi:hypothetical protein
MHKILLGAFLLIASTTILITANLEKLMVLKGIVRQKY